MMETNESSDRECVGSNPELGDDCPHCDTCGAPITTGMMAAFCPRGEKCEFWPVDADEETQNFMRWVAGKRDSP